MVRWTEIVEGLWPSYQFKYKDMRGFGVAFSQKLKPLWKNGVIQKKDRWYGTLNSSAPTQDGTRCPKSEKHVLKIASGLLALCSPAKYYVEGKLYPEVEFRENALMHLKTGYHPVYQLVLDTAKYRQACLGPDVKKTDECMVKYGLAREAFKNETEILIQRLSDGVDKLETSWCKICESLQNKKISAKAKTEVKDLLRII